MSGGGATEHVIQERRSAKELGPALWATLKILFTVVQEVKSKGNLALATEVTGNHTAGARSEKSNPGVSNVLFL